MKTLFASFFLSLLAAISSSANTLPTGVWRLESYNFQQKIAFPIDKDEVTLTIREGGKLGGRSGCNVYGGSYSNTDGKLKIGDLISTMMACDEPTMQFEQTFFKTLEGAAEFVAESWKLTIIDPKTGNFVKFTRVEDEDKCLSADAESSKHQ